MFGAQVSFTVNGERHEAPVGTLLTDFLSGQGVDVERIALERNREVVPRAAHAELVVVEGDVYEVVQFVGGG